MKVRKIAIPPGSKRRQVSEEILKSLRCADSRRKRLVKHVRHAEGEIATAVDPKCSGPTGTDQTAGARSGRTLSAFVKLASVRKLSLFVIWIFPAIFGAGKYGECWRRIRLEVVRSGTIFRLSLPAKSTRESYEAIGMKYPN